MKQGAKPYIIDGNKKTCLQDSIIVASRWAGVWVVKTQVYKYLPPSNEELDISLAICYVHETVCACS